MSNKPFHAFESVVFFVLILVAVGSACVQPISTPAPTIEPTATRLIPTETQVPAITATSQWSATVKQVTVKVRSEPDGDVTDYLKSGDKVTVLLCDERWCNIRYVSPETKKQTTGYIFKGCLDVKSSLGCESKP